MMKFYHITILFFSLTGCTIFYSKQVRQIKIFEQELLKTGYANLFQAKEVWQNGGNKELLEAVINSEKTSNKGKFLAAELLAYHNISIAPIHFPTLAKAYTYALANSNWYRKHQLRVPSNGWGTLYEDDFGDGNVISRLGVVGDRLITIGQPTIPYLIKLLDNAGEGFRYFGSEITQHNEEHYRVKDFAAFFLSKITKVPWQFYRNKKKRDIEIERFKKELLKQLAKKKK